MAFLTPQDYTVQIRTEISRIIDNTVDSSKLAAAEKMAIAQVRNHLAGRYDVNTIFAATGDARDSFIIMIVIDLALYHLWSKEGGNNIPKLREVRYNDALEWLKAVQNGQTADLPEIADESGEVPAMIRIWSKNAQENNRY